MRFLRDNGLTLALLAMFLLTFVGQILAGHAHTNEERVEHGLPAETLPQYLTSGDMWEATAENWESEFLQMFVFVVLTVFLFQKGSSQSKDPEAEEPEPVDREPDPSKPGAPWPVRRGGIVGKLYEHSLSLAFLSMFLVSWAVHAIGGLSAFNEERRLHGQGEVGMVHYYFSSTFWFESLQNWQSEFLAIAAMVALSVFLRQRGSPESKPVDAATGETGSG